MRTRAVRDGDDYVINGTKIYITNRAVADVCLLYAKTQPDRGSKGITAFVVECDRPGFKVAQKLRKMGFRGSQTAELVFENLRVPMENIVGAEHSGHQGVMCGLDLERSLIAAISVGVADVRLICPLNSRNSVINSARRSPASN
jgi:isovaleryl-CoA dehydrogenase